MTSRAVPAGEGGRVVPASLMLTTAVRVPRPGPYILAGADGGCAWSSSGGRAPHPHEEAD